MELGRLFSKKAQIKVEGETHTGELSTIDSKVDPYVFTVEVGALTVYGRGADKKAAIGNAKQHAELKTPSQNTLS